MTITLLGEEEPTTVLLATRGRGDEYWPVLQRKNAESPQSTHPPPPTWRPASNPLPHDLSSRKSSKLKLKSKQHALPIWSNTCTYVSIIGQSVLAVPFHLPKFPKGRSGCRHNAGI